MRSAFGRVIWEMDELAKSFWAKSFFEEGVLGRMIREKVVLTKSFWTKPFFEERVSGGTIWKKMDLTKSLGTKSLFEEGVSARMIWMKIDLTKPLGTKPLCERRADSCVGGGFTLSNSKMILSSNRFVNHSPSPASAIHFRASNQPNPKNHSANNHSANSIPNPIQNDSVLQSFCQKSPKPRVGQSFPSIQPTQPKQSFCQFHPRHP